MDSCGIEKLWVREVMAPSDQLVGVTNSTMMSEFDTLKQILAYVAENRLKEALEAEVPHMDVEAT